MKKIMKEMMVEETHWGDFKNNKKIFFINNI